MNFSKIAAIIIIVLLISFAGFVYIHFSDGQRTTSQSAKINPYVTLAEVNYKEHPTEVNAWGRIEEARPVALISTVSGKINEGEVLLRKGQQFKKGRLLLEIMHNPKKVAAYKLKKQFLDSLARIVYKLKRDTIDTVGRWQAYYYLVDVEKPVPEIIKAKTPKEQAYLDTSNIAQMYEQVRKKDEELAKYVFYAPYKGNFERVYLSEGSQTAPGDTIATILNNDSLILRVGIPAMEVDWIYTDAEVDLYQETDTTRWDGKIMRIGNRTDSLVYAYIRVEAGDSLSISRGMKFKAVIPGKSIAEAMEAPLQALRDSNKIFVYKNGRIILKSVEIEKVKHQTVLFKGLKKGEKIVLNPPDEAKEGIQVEISSTQQF